MYKSLKFKSFSIAFHIFNISCKKVDKVYNTGVYKKDTFDFISYFFVLYRFRIIIYIDKEIRVCNGKIGGSK